MKIIAVVQKDERSIQIEFPCGDKYLTKQLGQIEVTDLLDNRHILTSFIHISFGFSNFIYALFY